MEALRFLEEEGQNPNFLEVNLLGVRVVAAYLLSQSIHAGISFFVRSIDRFIL